jgi:hypothetical protein
MLAQDTTTVFSFRTYDGASHDMVLAPFQAERSVILSRYSGEVLEGTGHEVPRHALDNEGRYRRVATGWGELD